MIYAEELGERISDNGIHMGLLRDGFVRDNVYGDIPLEDWGACLHCSC
jgi:hypothetical protein